MVILSRKIGVYKSREQVCSILQSCAYSFPKAIFCENSFSMYCSKRTGILSKPITLISVRGKIVQQENPVEVSLSIVAGWEFYLGCIIVLTGVVGLTECLILRSLRWIPEIGLIQLGLIIIGKVIWEGKSVLDRIISSLSK